MGATHHRATTDKKNDEAGLPYSGELFTRYAGAIYGILFRVLRDEKRSEEILIKTFVEINAKKAGRDSKANGDFRKLLAVSMSLATADLAVRTTRPIAREKDLEGLLGRTLSSADDPYALGRAIRKKLNAFRKG